MTLGTAFRALGEFAFLYPLFMAYVWISGSIYYYFYREKSDRRQYYNPPSLSEYPSVTFIVPCHNEGENIRETLLAIVDQQYPRFEIIAVNDGSTDQTGELLEELADRYDEIRVIHLATNQGKAMAMRVGTIASNNEILICLDGDALLDKHATPWIVRHFIDGPRVGAVTGNPRVRNRTTLLGKIQVGEFSSIIGLIKRTQRIYGRVFTVSGVVAAFRRTALHSIGFWNCDMVTEDIDVSWRLQLRHWDIRYEPNALCYILMPETWEGLWKQRLRWAQGGIEVFGRYFREFFKWKSRRMWLVATELVVSTLWAYAIVTIFLVWLAGLFIELPAGLQVDAVLPGWSGTILGATCLIQFGVSLLIDSRYEPHHLGRYYYWMIWYPMIYWAIQVAASVVSVPKAFFKKSGERAVWVSPDRGIKPGSEA